jgi:hypothetical protein
MVTCRSLHHATGHDPPKRRLSTTTISHSPRRGQYVPSTQAPIRGMLSPIASAGFVPPQEMCVRELAQSLFDIYALGLPRGHGFGRRPPIGVWRSDDDRACGVVTRDIDHGSFGVLVMRRRVDDVWTVTAQEHGLTTLSDARTRMEPLLKEGVPPEPMPANTAPRPALHDLQARKPSEIFTVLLQPSHHVAFRTTPIECRD